MPMPRAAEDFEVVVARLDASPGEVRALQAHLSAEERQRAARFFFERHRRRFIVARAILRELLGARLGVRPAAVELVYGRSGKPRLANNAWRFSLSHCDDVALFAFSRAAEIGVDIEAMRPIRAADAIAAHFFSPREHEAYAALPSRDKLLGFLHCWTRKEAFVKALGGGLSMPLHQFDVTLSPRKPARILRIGKRRGDGGWRLHSFFPLPGFIAAIARHPA